MNKVITRSHVLLLAMLCLGVMHILVASFPLSAQSDSLDDAAIEQIDRILSDMVNAVPDFSGTVLIARGEDVLFTRGYGYANIEWRIPNASDTVFRIGNLTTQFTAMAILKLQEDGLLSINDPVCDYLPECPESWAHIRIYHLLTHTSGLPCYTNIPDVMQMLRFSNVETEVVNDVVSHLEPQFEPGSHFAYSYSGYHLLGEIIVNVTSMPYAAYLEETFFDPLDLQHTQLEDNNVIIPHHADGYITPDTRANYLNMQVPYSAGGMVSTVGDLFRWQHALFTGQVVDAALIDEMWAHEVDTGRGYAYGYGLAHTPYDTPIGPIDAYVQGGNINGFSGATAYLPDLDMTFVVLTNRENSIKSQVITTMMNIMIEAWAPAAPAPPINPITRQDMAALQNP